MTPSILTLITTYKCTSACRDCCFCCSPHRTEQLKLEELINYVDTITDLYKTIKVVVITGGECFLLGNDLNHLIKHIFSKGLTSRVVTNGYWARDASVAKNRLADLKEAGLTELNLSTGDDHLEYVPIESIKNAIFAGMSLDITTVLNVESGINRSFDTKQFLEDKEICCYLFPTKKVNPLSVVQGIWMPFTEESMKDVLKNNETPLFIHHKADKCANLFKSITISPTHRLFACCGLPCTYIKYLDLGNAKEQNIKFLYERQFEDFLKIWLFTEGPYKILDFISTKCEFEVKELNVNNHMCYYCVSIFCNPQYLNIIRKHYKEKYSSVMLKFNLQQTKMLK